MPKVMLVDDARLTRSLLKSILSKNGYEVVSEAGTGVEAVQKYTELRSDVIVMDVCMPEMDGMVALKEIIKIDPDARVLMCSAVGQQEVIDEALTSGARAYITKPFNVDSLLMAIGQAIA